MKAHRQTDRLGRRDDLTGEEFRLVCSEYSAQARAVAICPISNRAIQTGLPGRGVHMGGIAALSAVAVHGCALAARAIIDA
jgi:hypothetical protein